jgi:hypothetical protein
MNAADAQGQGFPLIQVMIVVGIKVTAHVPGLLISKGASMRVNSTASV